MVAKPARRAIGERAALALAEASSHLALRAYEALPRSLQLGSDRGWAAVWGYESNVPQLNRWALLDQEGHVYQVLLGLVADVVVHLRLEEAGEDINVPEADDVALELDRLERMVPDRRHERYPAEDAPQPDHAPALGQRDVRTQVPLQQRLAAGEPELDALHLGLGADTGERVLGRERRPREEQCEREEGSLRTHSAPASARWPAGCPRGACCATTGAKRTPARTRVRWSGWSAGPSWCRSEAAGGDWRTPASRGIGPRSA